MSKNVFRVTTWECPTTPVIVYWYCQAHTHTTALGKRTRIMFSKFRQVAAHPVPQPSWFLGTSSTRSFVSKMGSAWGFWGRANQPVLLGEKSRHEESSPDFSLVGTDAAGIAQPLPRELGPLPLFLDNDGFYSVLGPLAHHTQASSLWTHQWCSRLQPDQYLSHRNTSQRQDLLWIIQMFWKQVRPLPFYYRPWHRLTHRRGPHTCSRRFYTCNEPGCIRTTPFGTKQALNRHYEVVHLAERFDCPAPGCENVGEKGIKRFDNLVAHIKNKHPGAHPE